MFPVEARRAPGLSKLMGFFAAGGVRHPSTRMTEPPVLDLPVAPK
jgi:hypothetical protein